MHTFAFPPAFELRMHEYLMSEFNDFKHAHTIHAPTSIRINPLKESSPIVSESVPWTQYGRYLAERPVFTLDPYLHAGVYYVQEASSMFLEQAIKQCVDFTKPINALDLCAAPGGKSTHLLSLLGQESLLISNDVIRSRATILSENIQKWGYPNCLVTNNDPKDFQQLQGYFDLIVVDAPCSGEGLFRKDGDAMIQWSPDNVMLCAARQKRILNDIWPALKENGILIYCTCTYNEHENEENLLWLEQEYAVEFLPLVIQSHWGIKESVKQNAIGYRFFPQCVKGEGFFLSVIKKKESTEHLRFKSKSKSAYPEKKSIDTLKTWIQKDYNAEFKQWKDLVFAVPYDKKEDVERIVQTFRIATAGTNVARIKHDKLIPEHGLALSTRVNRAAFNEVNVTLEQALQFLRRETIALPDAEKGFNLLVYKNVPIGWVNILSNRANNMYPQEWRIRMS
jgi:16S rRNA C967 or C1407 C5-methylase (RsmB/RsmF family)/NOL1/NOP2/fmu family ribosome biogenesis protein